MAQPIPCDQAEKMSTMRPPLLTNSNYTYWKARIEGFILSLDVKVWRKIEKGYSYPLLDDSPNSTDLWTNEEERLLFANAKALNAIFSAVNQEYLKLISSCKIAKDAWTILQNFFEGNEDVRDSKKLLLSSQFDALRMIEDGTIAEYTAKLKDIANQAQQLGKNIQIEKWLKKLFGLFLQSSMSRSQQYKKPRDSRISNLMN
ncbi:hypothetical protein Scep_012588 [Stephania cephalantha]|uniref:Gag-pol polyprotein n=1 Tax=Stephania cephalantha TaxID=152367 RepID=A0AAP0P9P4_9MAGN